MQIGPQIRIRREYCLLSKGGLTIHLRVANFLQCICAKNYENWLAVDKVIAKIIRLTWPTLYTQYSLIDLELEGWDIKYCVTVDKYRNWAPLPPVFCSSKDCVY